MLVFVLENECEKVVHVSAAKGRRLLSFRHGSSSFLENDEVRKQLRRRRRPTSTDVTRLDFKVAGYFDTGYQPTMKLSSIALCLSSLAGGVSAFAPASSSFLLGPTSFGVSSATRTHHVSLSAANNNDDEVSRLQSFVREDEAIGTFDGDFLNAADEATVSNLLQHKLSVAAAPLAVATLVPLEAHAADGSSSSGGQLASAFAAYGHYLSLFIIVGCLVTERLTVKANMSDEEEDRLAIADTTLGISGALLAYTGYLRTTADWGKGFDYYAHEPVFWLKIFFVAIFGAVSFFPTTKIIQRSVAKRNDNLVPMSEELAARMTSLINAELLMVASIPLTASLMARGVGYMPTFPWQVGAGATVAALGGLGFKYVKEALDWEEPVSAAAAPSTKADD